MDSQRTMGLVIYTEEISDGGRWSRGNEAGKYLVVLLQDSSEQVIVGHRDGELAMLWELNVVLIVRHENKILLRMV